MKRSRYSRTKDKGGEESVFESKHNILLNKNQWPYLKRHYRLTNREFQVGKLVCRGYTNKEIAETLTINPGTVKTHLLNIYRKVRVTSKIALLLTFANDVGKLSTRPVVAPSIPIVGIEKAAKKRSASAKDIQKK